MVVLSYWLTSVSKDLSVVSASRVVSLVIEDGFRLLLEGCRPGFLWERAAPPRRPPSWALVACSSSGHVPL